MSTDNVFDRHCLHGGPVTVATIRFPPPEYASAAGIDNSINQRNVHQSKEDQYDLLKSQGRIVFACGPWIESHPLFNYGDVSSNGSSREGSGPDGNCNPYPPERGCHKVLAFGGANHGSSTFEGVHGMIFPSSSASLDHMTKNTSRKRRSQSSSLISVVAYGGRRISFLSGGGLWNNLSDGGSETQEDVFKSISIITTIKKEGVKCPYLEVSDWIHDTRLLDLETSGSSHNSTGNQQGSTTFLVAMGMVHNNCEIWGFHTTSAESGQELALCPTRLQCIRCDVRCMLYSFSFHGWDDELKLNGNSESDEPFLLPSLVAAAGTVFGDILVWGAVGGAEKEPALKVEGSNKLATIVARWLSDTAMKDYSACTIPSNGTQRIRVLPSYRLKGHLGSIFSVTFGGGGKYIASTSDDRSVRLWALTSMQESSATTSTDKTEIQNARENAHNILESESSPQYILMWTGWGHTARVWDVAFASPSSKHQEGLSSPVLVSAGEDSTARIWSPVSSKKEITYPLRGHRCESLWSVDVCEGIVVTAGNDGFIKLFDLESRLQPESECVRSFITPKDPLLATPVLDNDGCNNKDQQQPKIDDSKNGLMTKSPKKKKKKAKTNGQAICGMVCYGSKNKVQSKLMIATRAGGLFSLDLKSDVWTDYSSWSEQVVESSDDEKSVIINPSSGSCVGVHPSGERAVVGTTEGWIVIASICRSSSSATQSNPIQNIAFRAQSYRPIQSVSFIDDSSLLALYSRGSVIWFQFDHSLTPLHVMTLSTNGIPLSFAFNDQDQSMFIGDSRGNIAYFDLSQTLQAKEGDLCEQKPNSMLAKVHGKEHVTGMATLTSSKTMISVGNDGCMHQWKLNANNGQLQKLLSIPVPNVTGLRHVWNVSQSDGNESIIIGGFYGNDFVLLDSLNGYEFLRIATGGRQRRQDFFFRFPNSSASLRFPSIFGMAILTGQKDGSNMIDFHCSPMFNKSLAKSETAHNVSNSNRSCYSIGIPSHGEAINDACWIKGGESIYLLTGSNDCTVKLSKFMDNTFTSVIELPPHESCVRGVCSSHHPNSDSSLLITCGGKLSMEFYILDQTSSTSSTKKDHQLSCCVASLCSYRTLEKATIDHRMNAVRATPLLPHIKRCHLVLSGDSDGKLHLCVISEHPVARRTTIGTILKGEGRPVLCLELLRCFDKILAFVGTTGGQIDVWEFPGSIVPNGGKVHECALDGIVPTSPRYTFRAHQRGVNGLSVAMAQHHNSKDRSSVVVCSVGDDQALSTCVLDASHEHNGLLHLKEEHLLITKCASASALKAVKLVLDSDLNRIYTTGHDEQITLWMLEINAVGIFINSISSSPIGTGGSCIDCLSLEKSDGSGCEMIAACGEGMELISFNANILRAAKKLHEANYLLITTGAGFSADSGLQTYECAPAEYRDMCNPSKLTEINSTYDFQQFWLAFTKSYIETTPHIGYKLLDQWCQGGRLQHLRRPTRELGKNLTIPWWVYSSNVDAHFSLFKSFHDSLCEIHGRALEFRCACGIGYAGGEPRLGKEWEEWNKKMHSTESCKETTVQINQKLLTEISSSNDIFLCSHCQQPMRPNVLMFHDTDENVLKAINIQRERYQTWEGLVEDKVAAGGKLVILEMGCGVNVPAVRQESEEVLLDCAEKISHENGSDGSVCLIRINPKDARIDVGDRESLGAIPIASTAANALQKIDFWLRAFAER